MGGSPYRTQIVPFSCISLWKFGKIVSRIHYLHEVNPKLQQKCKMAAMAWMQSGSIFIWLISIFSLQLTSTAILDMVQTFVLSTTKYMNYTKENIPFFPIGIFIWTNIAEYLKRVDSNSFVHECALWWDIKLGPSILFQRSELFVPTKHTVTLRPRLSKKWLNSERSELVTFYFPTISNHTKIYL